MGWLGKPLAIELKKSGYLVVGTCSSPEKSNELAELKIQHQVLDLNQDIELSNTITNDTDVVIWCIPPSKINGNYGQRFAEISKQFNSKARFIFTSTTGVYPDYEIEYTEEFIPTEAEKNELYKAEEYVKNDLKNRLTIIRFAGLIGSNRHPAKFFAGKTGISNGISPVNLIHLDDCIGIINAIIKKEKWGLILNACSSIHPTREEYYKAACKHFNLEAPHFEKGLKGKTISNLLSKQVLDYEYKLDNPFDFLG